MLQHLFYFWGFMITLLDPDSWATFMHEPNLRQRNSPIDLNFNIDYREVRWKST